MAIVHRQMVRHAGNARVHVAAAKVFGRDNFARGRFHQGRPCQKDGALLAHNHGFV